MALGAMAAVGLVLVSFVDVGVAVSEWSVAVWPPPVMDGWGLMIAM